MEISKKNIRIDYAPLNVAVSVVILTPNSPVTQVFNGFTGEYDPDRSLTPTVILPQVVASAADGSWPQPYSNQYLANMKWFANGEDITTLKDWEGLYVIEQSGSIRGAIRVKRNLMPGEQISLHFTADLVDSRLGINNPIKTDPIVLSTADKSQNMYSVGIGDDQIIQYNAFKDKLFLYDFKVSHGLMAASTSARSAAKDENSYERDINVHVFRGDEEINDGYEIKLFRVNPGSANVSYTEMTVGNDLELTAITRKQISLDLRLIPKGDYVIRIIAENREVAQIQFSINRINPAFAIRTTNGTAINPSDTQRYDEVMVDTDGNIVECPGSIIKFIWKTDTVAKKGVVHNEGEATQFLLSDTGIGSSYNDSWMEIFVEAEPKNAHKVATDKDGNIFTDASGNPFIFN